MPKHPPQRHRDAEFSQRKPLEAVFFSAFPLCLCASEVGFEFFHRL